MTGVQKFFYPQNSRSPLKFRRQNGDNRFRVQESQILGALAKNVISTTAWPSGFEHPCRIQGRMYKMWMGELWKHMKGSHCGLITGTYLLTPWSRVLLEKPTGSAASQEIPRFFFNPKVHHRTHKCPPPVPILSQLHPFPTTPSNFLKIHLNIILQSASGSPQWSLSLRSPHQNPVHPSPLRNTRHMPRPSHSSRFYNPHNIR